MLNQEIEIWKDILDYEGYYQVSNLGKIRSVDRLINCKNGVVKHLMGKILNQHFDGSGNYKFVALYKCCKSKLLYVHRLVAQAFLSNPNNLPEVNHEDGIKTNNCFINLKWVTPKGNMRHAADTGLLNIKRGEKSGKSKLTEEIVLEIRKLYTSGKFNQLQLAERFNVDGGHICNIIKGKSWAHIKEGICFKSNQKKGSKNSNSKLTELDVIDIKNKYFKENMKLVDICTLFNVHKTTVGYIIKGKTWKHII